MPPEITCMTFWGTWSKGKTTRLKIKIAGICPAAALKIMVIY